MPLLKDAFKESKRTVNDKEAQILSNGEYELAMIPLAGWENVRTVYTQDLHPVSKDAAVIMATDQVEDSEIYVTLQLWKKQGSLTKEELNPIESIQISEDKKLVTIVLADKQTKVVTFN